MKRLSGVLAVLILAGMTAIATAQTATVPQLINYQGKLTDLNGNPLATANYTLEFNIYDVKTGGTPVWGPLLFDGGTGDGHGARVPVVQGHFNVFLGPVDTASRPVATAFAGPDRWLGIKVDGGSELAPRQQILSSPYAIQAHNADMVDNKQLTDLLTKTQYDPGSDGRVNAADHATNATNANLATQANMLGPSKVTLSGSDVNLNAGTLYVRDSARTRAVVSQYGDLYLYDGSGNTRGAITDGGTMNLWNSEGKNLVDSVAGADTGQIVLWGDNWISNVWISDANSLRGGGLINRGLIWLVDPNNYGQCGMEINASNQGVVWGDTKSFIVAHPTKPGFQIVYTCPEGPEAAMYNRGTVGLVNGRATIELPEHFSVLASTGTMTVHLTPRSLDSKGLAVASTTNQRIEIGELAGGAGSYPVDYLVYAVRTGYENYEVVRKEDQPPESAASPAGPDGQPRPPLPRRGD